MSKKRQPQVYGKRIVIRAGSWLRAGPDWNETCAHRVHRTTEFVGEWGSFGYVIPMGGKPLYTGDASVVMINDFPRLKRYTLDEASENNTSLATCCKCGKWLEDGDPGYGTTQGYCGCEDQPEDTE